MQFEIQAQELEKYIKNKESYCLIDMRTPGEFHDFHIPSARSYPILSNEEHRDVGILYTGGEHQKAKMKALSYALPKVEEYTQSLLELREKYEHTILYCSRGGMRSRVFYSMLRAMGFSVQRLRGGYRDYRRFVRQRLEELSKEKEFIVLHGKTGVGKTEILKNLEDWGASVLDLEGLAHHRGSHFGNVGLGEQPSQKLFESYLYEKLLTSPSPIYTEGESSRIGNVIIPKYLYEKINQGRAIVIEDTMENRIHRIKKEYLGGDKGEILNSLDHLRRYLSEKSYLKFRDNIERGEYDKVIEALMRNYYDSHYAKNYKDSDPHLSQGRDILSNILQLSQEFFPPE